MSRYQGKHNKNKQWESKRYAELSQALIADYSAEQLKQLIAREAKTANSRLRRLRESGRINSPYVADKWKHFENSPYGTDKGLFSASTSGKTINQLREQYLTIRQFLSRNYTAEGMEERRREYAKRTGLNYENMDSVEYVLQALMNMGFRRYDFDSDTLHFIEMELGTTSNIDEVVQKTADMLNAEYERQQKIREEYERNGVTFR